MEDYQLEILADTIGARWPDTTKDDIQAILSAVALIGHEPGISHQGMRFLEALANLLRTLNEQLE